MHKCGFIYFLILALIAAPIIQIVIGLLTEPIIVSVWGDTSFGGWALSDMLSSIITGVVILVSFFWLYRLVPVEEE